MVSGSLKIDPGLGQLPTDLILPFQLERSAVRGRHVRLGAAASAIVGRHRYPPAVARLLVEALALGSALAAALKYEGMFTLQIRGDGPVPMLVTDVSSDGAIRGYAQLRDQAHDDLGDRSSAELRQLVGAGHLAFTVDQGPHTERYQGIVDLDGDSLAECVQHYFRQSEQIRTGLEVASGRLGDGWTAAALMLQQLPAEGSAPPASDEEDDWRRSMLLLGTVTGAELLDDRLPATDLLFRLFHEEGVRVFEPTRLVDRCRCSRERVMRTLVSLGADEVAELADDGTIEVSCEFCNARYETTPEEVDAARDAL